MASSIARGSRGGRPGWPGRRCPCAKIGAMTSHCSSDSSIPTTDQKTGALPIAFRFSIYLQVLAVRSRHRETGSGHGFTAGTGTGTGTASLGTEAFVANFEIRSRLDGYVFLYSEPSDVIE